MTYGFAFQFVCATVRLSLCLSTCGGPFNTQVPDRSDVTHIFNHPSNVIPNSLKVFSFLKTVLVEKMVPSVFSKLSCRLFYVNQIEVVSFDLYFFSLNLGSFPLQPKQTSSKNIQNKKT